MAKKMILLETSDHVELVSPMFQGDHDVMRVAVTADALEAADRLGIECDAICKHADSRKLSSVEENYNIESYSLLRQLESFVAKRQGDATDDGPGFMSGQGYHVQYAISSIVTRAYLIVETIKAVMPEVVMAFQDDVDLQFRGQGYDRNPWWDIIEKACLDRGIRLLNANDMVSFDCIRADSKFDIVKIVSKLKSDLRRRASNKWWMKLMVENARIMMSNHGPHKIRDDIKGLRLLMVGSLVYDWLPVLARLRKVSGAKCYFMNVISHDQRDWNISLDNSMYDVFKIKRIEIDEHNNACDGVIANECLFEEWRNEGGESKKLEVMGMDLLPPIAKYLQSMMRRCPAILHHADAAARRVIDVAQPHAVCFYSIHTLATKRLAYQCRKRGIPVICYQHGGGYGTHDVAKNEQLEAAHADYFLTYGKGIMPREKEAFVRRAKYVPMGSTRLEANIWRRNKLIASNKSKNTSVLWIAEITTGNTRTGPYSIEDTERYLRQRECLDMLGNQPDVRVVYRPYPYFVPREGTTRWIVRSGLKNVVVDASKSMISLIAQADIVITDASCNTVWNEVLVMKKPFIVYCDPQQTLLLPHFKEDLERACVWCKTWDELTGVLRELIQNRKGFIERLEQKDTADFIAKYVNHKADEACVDRVISFLKAVVNI